MYYLYGLILLLSVVVDQLTKYWAVIRLQGSPSISIIGTFLSFTYVENRGAAFGILQNQKVFFLISTIILIGVIIYMVLINKKVSKYTKYTLVLILGGAIGNFIDRMRLGYVVDFIDVKFGTFYDFPVFNIADCCVVVGTIILILLILLNKFEKSEING